MTEQLTISDLKIGQLISFDVKDRKFIGWIVHLEQGIGDDVICTYHANKIYWYSLRQFFNFSELKNIEIINKEVIKNGRITK